MANLQEFSPSELARDVFEKQLLPAKKPFVLRGLVDAWPIVKESKADPVDALKYLCSHDNGTPVYTVVAPPNVEGRLFYSDDLAGVNFQKVNAGLTSTIKQMVAMSNETRPHSVSIQAAGIKECLPDLLSTHTLSLLDTAIEPTIWVSNRSRVAAHFDLNDNIACNVIGRRRFTLFPPDQVANLYVGPTLNSPGGVPTSLVDIQNPDLDRFPNFEHALANSLVTELEPGDAIFIPSPWWHSVESLDPVNVLINYWWNTHLGNSGPTANNSMMMGMLTIAAMDKPQRDAWRALFDYFVFKNSGDPAAHLPHELNDVATQLNDKGLAECFAFLRNQLK